MSDTLFFEILRTILDWRCCLFCSMYEALDSITSTTKRSGLNYMKTRLVLMRSLVYVVFI